MDLTLAESVLDVYWSVLIPIGVLCCMDVMYSPPFSQFFVNCGAFVDRAGDHPVSSALMSLFKYIWSPARYVHATQWLHCTSPAV